MTDRQKNQGESGFTVLEVIVALIILTMALSVFYRSTALSITTEQKAEAQAYASILAESLLGNLQTADALYVGEMRGKEGEFSWLMNIEERVSPSYESLGAKLLDVRVEVFGPNGGVTLHTLRAIRGQRK